MLLEFTRSFRADFIEMQMAMINKEDPDRLVLTTQSEVVRI